MFGYIILKPLALLSSRGVLSTLEVSAALREKPEILDEGAMSPV